MFYSDKLFDSASEFLDYFLRDDAFRTSSKFHANQPGRGGMIFRGQSDSSWRLIPSAFRAGALANFTPQPPYEPHKSEHPSQYLGVHLHAESRAVFIFLEAADRMGLITPIDYATTADSADMMQAAFDERTDFDYDQTFPSLSFQRATALAQHHGVPTRYMDWSESPLVAAYFAAIGASSFNAHAPRSDQEIAVYYLYTFSIDKDNPVQLIKAPRHENFFLQRQQGLFTNIRYANTHFLSTGEWPALDEISADGRLQIFRARLPAAKADDLLRGLFDLGITQQSLMPSLNNAATAYQYAHRLYG